MELFLAEGGGRRERYFQQLAAWKEQCTAIDRECGAHAAGIAADDAVAKRDALEATIRALLANCLGAVVVKLAVILRGDEVDAWTADYLEEIQQDALETV